MNLSKHFSLRNIIILIAIFSALGLTSYAAFMHLDSKGDKVEKEEKVVKVSFVEEKEELNPYFLDSDNDGAYDWVEELWPELDPQNPDSDGDGVLDGRYIEQKKRIRDKDRSDENLPELKLTESEKLGRGLYTALLAVEQTGGTLDEKAKEKVSENVANYIKNLPLGTRTFIRDELNLVSDSKQNSIAYRDRMLDFYKKNPINTSEIALMIEATDDPKKFQGELHTAVLKYDNYINTLSEMYVPYAVAGRHTELLNAAGQLEGGLKNLLREELDDIVALSSLIQLEKTMATLIDANYHIEKYFNIIEQKGLFDNTEESLPVIED